MKQKTMSRSKIVQCDFGKKDARMNEKISENRKRGVLLLLLVVLFWFVLLAVVPAMAAEKTCLVSVPVSVQLTGTAVSGQTENTPVFTVVMEAQNERNELPLPEQNQIQMGAEHSMPFCIQHREIISIISASLPVRIRILSMMSRSMM